MLATEDTALGAELQTNRFIFLHTDLAHNDVVAKRRTFQKFLETSRLSLRWEKPGETSRQLSPELPDRSASRRVRDGDQGWLVIFCQLRPCAPA